RLWGLPRGAPEAPDSPLRICRTQEAAPKGAAFMFSGGSRSGGTGGWFHSALEPDQIRQPESDLRDEHHHVHMRPRRMILGSGQIVRPPHHEIDHVRPPDAQQYRQRVEKMGIA